MSRGGGEVETNGAHYGIAINFPPGKKLAVIADQTDQLTLAVHRLKMASPLWNVWTHEIELLVLAATATSFRGASVECNGGWRREIHHLGEWNRVDSSW